MTFGEFLERYGVTLAIVGALTLVVVLLPGNADRSQVTGFGSQGPTVDGSTADGFGEGALGAGGASGGVGTGASSIASGRGGRPIAGVQVGEGQVAGAVEGAEIVLGQGACRPDGRMKGVSVYMPPCLSFSGLNGGSTAQGVTGDTIKVVTFIGPPDPATQAILRSQRLADEPEIRDRAYDAARIYGNHHYVTYGRRIEFIPFQATGSLEDDEVMIRDAKRIAEEIKPFAVITGDPAAAPPKKFAQEIAARGIICMCTVSLTSQFYLENPPYIFSSLPTSTQYGQHIAEFVAKRLAGRNAEWAGDEYNPRQGLRLRERVFGLIYFEGLRGKVDREGGRAKDILVAELARYGLSMAHSVGYTYDPGRNQNEVSNFIAQMREHEVTTIIGYFDPLSPSLITAEASRQEYFPEWFIAGTGLSDTSAAGRIYDQQQWQHAYGMSPLWVTWADVRNSPGYRIFYHARPDIQPGTCGPDPCEGALINIYVTYVGALFTGIQMAGPNLTPDTFAQGMFNFPLSGGTPGAPLVKYTREHPTAVKDFTEVWYDRNRPGKDERGSDGLGMIMKARQGRRYQLGQWPQENSYAFDANGAVDVSDNPVGGGDPPHEQDGHNHAQDGCMSCG